MVRKLGLMTLWSKYTSSFQNRSPIAHYGVSTEGEWENFLEFVSLSRLRTVYHEKRASCISSPLSRLWLYEDIDLLLPPWLRQKIWWLVLRPQDRVHILLVLGQTAVKSVRRISAIFSVSSAGSIHTQESRSGLFLPPSEEGQAKDRPPPFSCPPPASFEPWGPKQLLS